MPQPKSTVDPDHNLLERNGIWYVRYKIGGKSRCQSLHTTDVRKARKERDRILKGVAAQREGHVIEAEKTWADAVEGYLARQQGLVRAGELAASAAQRYGVSIVQITLALGWEPGDGEDGDPERAVPLSAITKGTITEFVDARREEGRATSTILNDITAWSHVLSYAENRDWIDANPLRSIERRKLVGNRRTVLRPPTDPEVDELIREVAEWSPDIARLFGWLRETGMRLAEALNLRASDIHPCGTQATLRVGVKRNRGDGGPMTRTIDLGRAAALLSDLPTKGRLFSALPADSAVVSTHYGQWRRQKQGRENRAAEKEDREPIILPEFRIRRPQAFVRRRVTGGRRHLHLPAIRAPGTHSGGND